MKINYDRFIVDQEPHYVMFTGEPYVVALKTGFVVAADLIILKTKIEKTILLGAQSLCLPLYEKIADNNNKLAGIECWIYKDGPERTSKYIVED